MNNGENKDEKKSPEVKIWRQSRCVVIRVEEVGGEKKVRSLVPVLVDSGYRVERKPWGYLVSDPTMKFGWEAREMLFDVRKTLGEL